MNVPFIDIGDQTGRTFLVTGANSGIGLETSRRLARAGAHVIMACRSVERGRAAAKAIGGHTEVLELDTSSLASVEAAAATLEGNLDVLINNAGIMAVPETRSVDGFELQMATNFLGPFALTARLLPRIADRVVMVSSLMHRRGHIDLDDLNWRTRQYSRWGAYGQSKLADLMFASYLQERLSSVDSPVRALSAHPGISSTNLLQGLPAARITNFVAASFMSRFGQDARDGALPTLLAATAGSIPGGAFVGPAGLGGLRGAPVLTTPSVASKDRNVQQLLVREAEALTGVQLSI